MQQFAVQPLSLERTIDHVQGTQFMQTELRAQQHKADVDNNNNACFAAMSPMSTLAFDEGGIPLGSSVLPSVVSCVHVA